VKTGAYDVARPSALMAKTRVLPTRLPHLPHQPEVNALSIPIMTRRPVWTLAAATWTAGSWKQYWGIAPTGRVMEILSSSACNIEFEEDASGLSAGNIECSTLAAQVSRMRAWTRAARVRPR
jgi:hypothetical protein